MTLPTIFKMRHNILLTLVFILQSSLTLFCQKSKIDSTILNANTVTICDMDFTAIYKTDDTFYILDSLENIVFKSKDYTQYFEFTDFDNDGQQDIIFTYFGNNPIKDLIMYNSKKNEFIAVDKFSNFPEPESIQGTKYYYSYHRSGCADSNWDSDLFYIENFRAIKIGNIAGRECEDVNQKTGIYIYKINGESKNLFETLEIKTIEKYKDKWGFIGNYWKNKYLEFK